MKKREFMELVGKAGNAIMGGIAQTGDAVGSMLENWRAEEEQRARVIAAQIAYETKMCNANYVRHDLGVSLMGMTPPTGLTAIHDPSNLTYLENHCTDDKTFAFYWQKSVRKFALLDDDLDAIKRRVNSRIRSLAYQLKAMGYTNEDVEREYPALFNGFEIANVRNDTDGAILVVRIR